MRKYSMLPPNGGYFASLPPQGSVGMMHPMFLWSNEYMHGSMKRGQSGYSNNPYNGGITRFSPHVTPQLQDQVQNCSDITVNPGACQTVAVKNVFSIINNQVLEHPQAAKRMVHNRSNSRRESFDW